MKTKKRPISIIVRRGSTYDDIKVSTDAGSMVVHHDDFNNSGWEMVLNQVKDTYVKAYDLEKTKNTKFRTRGKKGSKRSRSSSATNKSR